MLQVRNKLVAGNVRLAQLDRAFGYGPKGRGFESSNARYNFRIHECMGSFFMCSRNVFDRNVDIWNVTEKVNYVTIDKQKRGYASFL